MQNLPLIAQVAVSGALAGLCWTVQLAVYPCFGHIGRAAGPDEFRRYHTAYTRAMGSVAGPLMVAELGLSIGLLAVARVSAWGVAGLVLTLATWVWTFAVMVPRHARLQATADAAEADRLTEWNWPRTALWTARVLLATVAVAAG